MKYLIAKYFKVEVKKANYWNQVYWYTFRKGIIKRTVKNGPFLLFLHGYGERGDIIEMLKKQGQPK